MLRKYGKRFTSQEIKNVLYNVEVDLEKLDFELIVADGPSGSLADTQFYCFVEKDIRKLEPEARVVPFMMT